MDCQEPQGWLASAKTRGSGNGIIPNAQQKRVQAVMDLWPPQSDVPPPGMVAKWLKDWNDDALLLERLRECAELGHLFKAPGYVAKVLNTSLRSGKKPIAPQRSAGSSLSAYERDMLAEAKMFEEQRGGAA